MSVTDTHNERNWQQSDRPCGNFCSIPLELFRQKKGEMFRFLTFFQVISTWKGAEYFSSGQAMEQNENRRK